MHHHHHPRPGFHGGHQAPPPPRPHFAGHYHPRQSSGLLSGLLIAGAAATIGGLVYNQLKKTQINSNTDKQTNNDDGWVW